MNIVKDLHKQWAEKVVPKDAPPIQKIEMERSFYSGFYANLNWGLHNLAMLPDTLAANQVEEAHKECEAYFKALAEAAKEGSAT